MMYDQNDIQQNQYTSGSVNDQNYNTSWMSPTSPAFGGGDNTTTPTQNNTSLSPGVTSPSPVSSTPSGNESGTLLNAVSNGNWSGINPLPSSQFPSWMSPQQTQQQVPQLDYSKLTPQAGWDTSKLLDPNKHDPKYDWLRSVQMVGGNQDLNAVVNYYNQLFGQNNGMAQFLGGDSVRFNGWGDTDVLFDQEGKRENLWAPIGGGVNNPGGQAMPLAANNSPMFNPEIMAQIMQRLFSQGRYQKLNRRNQPQAQPGYTGMPMGSKDDLEYRTTS